MYRMNVRACQSEYYQFILMKSSSCVISRKPTKVSLRDSFTYELERRSSSSTMPANELVTSISQVSYSDLQRQYFISKRLPLCLFCLGSLMTCFFSLTVVTVVNDVNDDVRVTHG